MPRGVTINRLWNCKLTLRNQETISTQWPAFVLAFKSIRAHVETYNYEQINVKQNFKYLRTTVFYLQFHLCDYLLRCISHVKSLQVAGILHRQNLFGSKRIFTVPNCVGKFLNKTLGVYEMLFTQCVAYLIFREFLS